jgi:hypothetical protein
MKQTPMYQSYTRVAPHPQDWPILCTKLGNMLRQDYNWSADVTKIKLPVLLVFGDADAVRTASAVQFFELLGGGHRDGGWDASGMSNARLAILARHNALYDLFLPATRSAGNAILRCADQAGKVTVDVREFSPE